MMIDPTSSWRRRFRARRNLRRLENERRRYGKIFAGRKLSIPDDEQIRKHFLSGFPALAAKRKGDLSIISIFHDYNWENAALIPSLKSFGTVRHYDWFDRFNHQGKDWMPEMRARMNDDLLKELARWIEAERPDVIFTYLSGELVSPAAMARFRAFAVPSVNLALNDKESFVGKLRKGEAYGMRDICRYFTLCWTSTEDALPKYCVEGALPINLPEGAYPGVHRPYDEEKIYDVTFAGQCYGDRPGLIEALRRNGIAVEAFGHGWPRGALSTEEMVKLYSRSRINLGFGSVADHSETYCLKGRDFEIPMSGGLYLTEHHPELERVYRIGEEIVAYRDFDDLLSKIGYLLSHPREAERIRKAGYERCRSEHTWEHRFERIFRLMGLL
ncbi:MAG: glycosyltransferase family 1 protein [Deltaproteobacteria bacterium]|nr:glycosyltransferase family 1 protein [Deltaproteobacteria bacterium]